MLWHAIRSIISCWLRVLFSGRSGLARAGAASAVNNGSWGVCEQALNDLPHCNAQPYRVEDMRAKPLPNLAFDPDGLPDSIGSDGFSDPIGPRGKLGWVFV